MRAGKGTKYRQIRDLLVEHLRQESYQCGDQLPTEHALTAQLDVSRTTVRQALRLLETEGLIEKRHGSGTFFLGEPDRSSERGTDRGLIGIANFITIEYIYPSIIQGIEDVLSENGYSLVLASGSRGVKQEYDAVRRIVDQGIKGLIIEPQNNLWVRDDHPILQLIESLDIPVVTTHWGNFSKRISTVTIDDIQAGYQATRYLIEKGHRRIAYIYKSDSQSGFDRLSGYRKALSEAEIAPDESLIQGYDEEMEQANVEQGYLLTRELLTGPERPEAIFYFNDFIALQGYRAIREAGLSIPGDISVIGFDNYHTSALVDPPLTTFEHPKYDLGRWAAKLLLDELDENRPTLPMKLIFEPVLVERASVG